MLNVIKLLLLIVPCSLSAQMKESWILRPQSEWPQIALTNNIVNKNEHSYIHPSFLYADTGFLIDNGADTIAVTAKHILLIARNKKTNRVTINNDLLLWS